MMKRTLLGSVGNVAADNSAAVVARFKFLESKMAALKTEVEAKQDAMDCLYQVGSNLYVEECNLHVRDGSGSSTSYIPGPNGLGNLIVGYNEENPNGSEKTGSHNVIVGAYHTYTDDSGLVTGWANTITGGGAVVIGGKGNVASGLYSTVSGGYMNEASGGNGNVADGDYETLP